VSDTLTPGYALNRLYSYAFEAPCTKRDPGLTDINMARDVLLVAIKQLAAERTARQAAEQERDDWYRDFNEVHAQLAERDQQLAALRAAAGLMSKRLVTGITNREDQRESLCIACGKRWAETGTPLHATACPTRALLAMPAAEPDDEIRMPIHPGIPGVGVVVSAGPRPELVIEPDVSSIDCERCGRYIELDEHEGDLCNDCRATMTAGEEAT
jgi:hypothetical protein